MNGFWLKAIRGLGKDKQQNGVLKWLWLIRNLFYVSVLEEAGKGAETLVQGRLGLVQAGTLKSWMRHWQKAQKDLTGENSWRVWQGPPGVGGEAAWLPPQDKPEAGFMQRSGRSWDRQWQTASASFISGSYTLGYIRSRTFCFFGKLNPSGCKCHQGWLS